MTSDETPIRLNEPWAERGLSLADLPSAEWVQLVCELGQANEDKWDAIYSCPRCTDALRTAGCACVKPLLGHIPGKGARCRLCNTRAWKDGQEDAACRTDNVGSAVRLLGFALFNLNKGNAGATETLVRKAYKALAGREWDE